MATEKILVFCLSSFAELHRGTNLDPIIAAMAVVLYSENPCRCKTCDNYGMKELEPSLNMHWRWQ